MAKLKILYPAVPNISLVVSVDVKHHVYLLLYPGEPVWPSGKALGW